MRCITLVLGFMCITICGAVGKAYDQCYELLYNNFCQAMLGNRVADFGCAGCSVQNGQNICVDNANAARSLAEPFWSEDTGVRSPSGLSGYDVAIANRVCAVHYNCYPLCYFDERLGRDNCFVQTTFSVWEFLFDYVTDNCLFV